MLRVRDWLVGLLISLVPAIAAAQALDVPCVREALTRGYAAIQTAQQVSRKTQTCTATCHMQIYGAFDGAVADGADAVDARRRR